MCASRKADLGLSRFVKNSLRDNIEGTLKAGKLTWCQGGRQHTEEAQARYTPGCSGGQSAPAIWLLVRSRGLEVDSNRRIDGGIDVDDLLQEGCHCAKRVP